MNLLESLQEKLKLEYLSDLGFIKDFSDLKEIVRAIPSDRYSLSEWNDAVEYITKKTMGFKRSEDAKEYMLNY